MDGLTVGTTSFVGQPDAMSEALDSHLKFTESGGNWWISSGPLDEYYYDGDAAQSEYYLGNYEESCLQTIVESDSQETVKFYWKVSSHQGYDYLAFYIDGELRDQITGEVDWQKKSYSLNAGSRTLKWHGSLSGVFLTGQRQRSLLRAPSVPLSGLGFFV